MKLRLVAVLLALPFAAFAADAPAAPEDPAHNALRQLKSTYETAVRTGNLEALKPLFAPETTAVMILGQEVKSYAELEEHWKFVRGLIGPGGTYTTKLNPETSLIFGEIALSRGTSDELVRTKEGREYAFTSRWTAVSRNVGGEWKVLRLHGSMDPVTNVFTTTFMQRAKLTYGIGGVVVGLVLGIIVGRRRKTASAAV
jgi:ketosteroid isomerase-like protein